MAEKAAGALLDHGIRAEDISIVFPESFGTRGRLAEAEAVADVAATGITTTTVADAGVGSVKGAGFGFAAGAMAALAAVFIPGVGLVLGGGALALAVSGMAATTVAGAVAGGVTGFLKDQGVPDESLHGYNQTLIAGGAVVSVTTMEDVADQAGISAILMKYGGNVASYLAGPRTDVVFLEHSDV